MELVTVKSWERKTLELLRTVKPLNNREVIFLSALKVISACDEVGEQEGDFFTYLSLLCIPLGVGSVTGG